MSFLSKLFVIAAIAVVASAVAGFWFVWEFAPIVGGEWWPYIHVIASLVAGYIAAQVSYFIVVMLAVGSLFS